MPQKIRQDNLFAAETYVRKYTNFANVDLKSYDFDSNGDAIGIDYYKMLKIIKDSGYDGCISIEYEGNNRSEEEGIMLTKKLLEKAGRTI